jgi:AcrR family transcriptional regulator
MARQPREPDPRVVRTRTALREALVALILERGWDAISVQDVCERAGVGRSTFYIHYGDKEDLLVGGFSDLKKALRAQAAGGEGGGAFAFARGLVEHAGENRRLFRAIVGRRSGQVVQQLFRQLLVELVREDVSGLAPAGADRDAAAHFIAGAFFEVLLWWLDSRSGLQVSQIDALLHRFTAPVLAELRRTHRAPQSGSDD